MRRSVGIHEVASASRNAPPLDSWHAAAMPAATPEDRNALVELMARYASIPDTKDFTDLPAQVFTERVVWDFGSVTGQPAAEHSRDELAAMLAPPFAGFVATHHGITNHQVTVDGDVGHVRAHVKAEHWVDPALVESGSNRWLLVGFYDHDAVRTADGWRIDKAKLTVTYEENANLLRVALRAGRDRGKA